MAYVMMVSLIVCVTEVAYLCALGHLHVDCFVSSIGAVWAVLFQCL